MRKNGTPKKSQNQWIAFEVKDFSFWRGWIWGQGAEIRKEYYLRAIQKLPIKEDFIRQKHSCNNITSVIVTSIPEPFDSIKGVKLIYLSNLSEELVKLSENQFTPRKSFHNFLGYIITSPQSLKHPTNYMQ